MADDSESRGVRLDHDEWAWLEKRAVAASTTEKKRSTNWVIRVMIWRAQGRAGLPPDRRSTRWKK
jgi:hypothetical protein